MKDGIIKGTGNSRYLKSSLNGINSWEDFKAALLAGTLPIDLNGINADGWQQIGDALNKANLLDDYVGKGLAVETVCGAFKGIMSQLVVTVDSGSTVTCTNGSKTITQVSGGTAVFYVPYGTWRLRATRSGLTSIELTVVVDIVKKYAIKLVYASPTFGSNSWEAIKVISEAGLAPTLWRIGDKKSITLSTGQVTNAVITDFNHDIDKDGSAIGITLSLEDCLNVAYKINDSNTNKGGWDLCQLRTTLNSTILSQLPSELQSAITAAAKKTSEGEQSSKIIISVDKLWLFSDVELFGSPVYSFPGEGSHYPLFSSDSSRIKKINNSPGTWWSRSPKSSDGYQFVIVVSSGKFNIDSAYFSYGILFGFCI